MGGDSSSTPDWVDAVKKNKDHSKIAGTYLHGILENGEWRRLWLNKLRSKKGLNELKVDEGDFNKKREEIFNLLGDSFEEYVNLDPIL